MPHPLARIVEELKREPSRTGSIIITVFGDAIVPRGGSVWLGTLLEFFESLDIDAGVVRTAMSRLTSDGWFERERVGRNSFYRLAEKGRQTFDTAVRHVYNPQPSDWTGRFELLLLGNGGNRDSAREALLALRAELAKAVVGQDGVISGLVIALLCRGHVLLEGVPGVAKTLLVRAMAAALPR